MIHAQIFCQMKGLTKIHNRAKFHLHSFCGSQVINFEKVSWQWSIHELGHFWGFLSPNSPKYAPILLKLASIGSIRRETNSVSRILEKFKFSQKQQTPKDFTFGPTLTLFFLLKMAEIEKKYNKG